jgi:NAD(P)-dependent dehydrogenase (short-subunit alcohol dehydrogenase family)
MPSAAPTRVLLLGASGTIGRATARALIKLGYQVVCLIDPSKISSLGLLIHHYKST